MITLKDANGLYVAIKKEDFSQAMTESGVTLFGMDFPAIAQFRKLYMALGGSMPITEESIKELENAAAGMTTPERGDIYFTRNDAEQFIDLVNMAEAGIPVKTEDMQRPLIIRDQLMAIYCTTVVDEDSL